MELAYLVVAVIGSVYTARLFQLPFIDGDLFWQKHLGEYVLTHRALPTSLGSETFTAAGAHWTPQEWLLGVFAYLTMSHNALWVLAVAAGLALCLTLLILGRRAQRFGASAHAVVAVIVLSAIDMEGAFGIRAQVFAWPLFALLLLLLDASGVAVFGVLALVVAWANLHASVMLALPIVWIDAAATVIQRGPRDPESRRRLIVSVLAPFCILCTPLGVKLPLYVVMLVTSPIRASISEWQHLGTTHLFFWFGALPLVVVAALYTRTLWREHPRDVVWAASLFAMTVLAVRNAPLLAIAIAPLSARGFDLLLGRFEWWRKGPDSSKGRAAAYFGAFCIAALAFAATLMLPPQKGAWHAPVATFARIGSIPEERRVFCYDFSVCSLALDYPNLLVFMDGRADPYPVGVWQQFNLIRHADPGWQTVLDQYRVDVVVARSGDVLDRALMKQPGWTLLPKVDPCCQTYVRPRV